MNKEFIPLPVVSPKKHRNLAQAVVAMLSERIRSGAIMPGDKLPTESEIMQAQNVSRAVAREAITHLQASGLVVTHRGKGTFLLEPPQTPRIGIDLDAVVTMRDLLDVMELRISLETEVAYLAALRRTEAQLAQLRVALDALHRCRTENIDTAQADTVFHLSIAQAAGNPYFNQILNHLGMNIIPRARINLAKLARDDLLRVNQEHEDIYMAIQSQDAETARAAMRSHLSNSRARLLRAHETNKDNF